MPNSFDMASIPELDNIAFSKVESVFLCIEQKSGQSRKGDPMITLKWEVVTPEKLKIKTEAGEVEVELSGRNISTFHLLTPEAMGYTTGLKNLHKALQLPMTVDVDTPNLKVYDGQLLRALLSQKVDVALAGDGVTPLTDDDGKPIKQAQLSIDRFLGKGKPTGAVAQSLERKPGW